MIRTIPFLLAITVMSWADAPQQFSITYLLESKDAFVPIPTGQFTMGSSIGNPDEAPVHRVKITKTFEMMKFEVTQAQWKAVMDSPHSRPRTEQDNSDIEPSHFKGQSLPVESVSYDAVQTFIKRLNGRDEHHVYRLPTEAEWEYAARAGGKQTAEIGGWCSSASGQTTHPIGQQPPNAWGLYDMIGNVMEWVEDWYAPDAYDRSPLNDPKGPASNATGGGQYKVYRGGAWLSEPRQCRPTFRGFDFPNTGYYSVGFRLVRTKK